MRLEGPLAVGFDLDHTLGIDNKLERVAFLRLLEPIVDAGGHALGTLSVESAAIDDLLEEQRGGALSIEDAVRRFARERGVANADDLVRRYLQMAPEMVDDFVVPAPRAHGVFAALQTRGIPTAILTNGWNPLQQRKADRLGFTGPVIVSADIGVQKPDARAFEAMLKVLGTPAERTWYVGDDLSLDVAGATGAGLPAIWLDSEGADFPSSLARPQATIQTIDQLLALIPGLGGPS